jgi:hypothetical protein
MADEIHYCKITKNGTYYHLNFLRVPKNGGKKEKKILLLYKSTTQKEKTQKEYQRNGQN